MPPFLGMSNPHLLFLNQGGVNKWINKLGILFLHQLKSGVLCVSVSKLKPVFGRLSTVLKSGHSLHRPLRTSEDIMTFCSHLNVLHNDSDFFILCFSRSIKVTIR